MTAYLETVAALAGELDSVAQVLGSLSAGQWSSPTLLVPVGPVSHWTVLELAGHLGFAMNMIDTLLCGESAFEPVLDRVSFFDQPRNLIAPLAYRTARDVTASKSGAEILDGCMTNFSGPVERARRVDPAFVGSTVLGAMRIDEFIATRVVEAVVHGLDLAQALDRSFTPSHAAVDCVADVLDALGRRKGVDRPEALEDDWLWVQVASGRRRHDDLPTPLLG